jgi:hypothetical protein
MTSLALQGLHRGASGVLARRVQDDTRVAPARLLLLLALIFRRVMKRYPHMWDEAPADDPA